MLRFLSTSAAVLTCCLPIPRANADIATDLPSIRTELNTRWRNMPPFRADFILHGLVDRRPEFERPGEPPWFPATPSGSYPQQSGWISIYPDHIRYRYIGKPPKYDITEVPLEVRYNGERSIKFNEISQNYHEMFPFIEKTRQDWCAHFMITLWQLNFIEKLRPGERIREYLLPDALDQPGYVALGMEPIENVNCVHLKRHDQDELWLAPQYDWNIVRRRWRKLPSLKPGEEAALSDKPLYFVSTHRDFVKVCNRYMPQEICMTEELEGNSYFHQRLLIRSYREIPNDAFEPTPATGWTWHITKSEKHSEIKRDREGFPRFEALITRLAGKTVRAQPGPREPLWLWLLALTPLGTAAAIVAFRGAHHARPR